MLEKTLQRYLVEQVKSRKLGKAAKVNSPSGRGWPDLVFVDKGGHVHLIEMKKPGENLKHHQILVHQELLDACLYTVTVLDNKPDINTYLDRIKYVNS